VCLTRPASARKCGSRDPNGFGAVNDTAHTAAKCEHGGREYRYVGPFHTHGSGQPSQFPPMCVCSQPAAVALRGRRRYVAAKLS
jgi:hypothetical protein